VAKLQGCAKDNKVWEEWEDDIIRSNYGKLSYDEICGLLLNRTNQSVQHRRRKLGLETIHKNQITAGKWSEDDEQLLLNNIGKTTIQEIAKMVGRNFPSVASKLDRMKKKGIIDKHKFDRKLWAKEEDLLLLENYQEDVNKIKKLLPHRSRKAIHHRWRLLVPEDDKREQRTYTVNMDFFSTPSILNSYWAGFIAADGCLTEGKHLFSVGLQARDGYHLEQLAEDVGYSGTVRYFTDGDGYDKAAMFIWGVRQWFLDLEKYFSIAPRKSLTLIPPKIVDEEQIKSYIRGFVDGDGSVVFKSSKKCLIGVCGTYEMMEWVKLWFEKWVPPNESNYKASNVCGPYNTKIFYYKVHGNRALKVIQELLSVQTPYLKRKWDPVISYLRSNPLP
jgi:hypothetical protein